MARKRNVDAENHLLTGGLVTGFLTFMGFLPAAAASAAVTGSLVGKDIQKAKKEEAFQRDFAAFQEQTKVSRFQAEEEIRKRREFVDTLLFYGQNIGTERFELEEKLEQAFSDAKVYNGHRPENYMTKRRQVSEKEILRLAEKYDSDKKELKVSYDCRTREFILISDNEEIYASFFNFIPYKAREKCREWGIPFRKLTSSEADKIKAEISQKLYAPYQFNYSKYR